MTSSQVTGQEQRRKLTSSGIPKPSPAVQKFAAAATDLRINQDNENSAVHRAAEDDDEVVEVSQ